MPYATRDGQRLYYEESGSGPAIVFSHGLFMDSYMFKDQVAEFSKSYRCIAWDERAHGKTADPEKCDPFTYYDSAADLMAILDHLGIDKAILVGMSQGGYLSLRAAITYPDRVRALVLIDTQALKEEAKAVESHSSHVKGCIEAGKMTDDIVDYAARLIMDPNWEGTPEWKERWKRLSLPNVLQAMTTLGSRDDISDKISQIKCPALVIHGSEDIAITPDRARKMHDSLVDSRMVLIEGETHAPNMTKPKEVNAEISKFFKEIGV